MFLAQAIGAWTKGFIVLRVVGQLVVLDDGLCFAEATGAWTFGVVVPRAVFLPKPLVFGQLVLFL